MPASARRRARRAPSEWDDVDRRAALGKVIKRRAAVAWWLGIVMAVGFAAFVTPAITAERWLLGFHAGTATEPGSVTEHHAAPFTVRAPMFAGYGHVRIGDQADGRIGGGIVVARGEIASGDEATLADAIARAMPRGPALYIAYFALIFVLAALFTHHMRRSNKGRLVRVQVVSLVVLAVLAVAVKIAMLSTALSTLVVPVAMLAMIPTMVLDRTVGLATGVLSALVVSLLAPFDVGLSILLLVQAATAGLVVAERPKQRWLAALTAGLVTTACTSATYLVLTYLTTGHAPELRDPLHSPWIAAAIGPALAAILAVPVIPLYQLLVGEITQGKLFALEDLSHPLLRQIAENSPGTWQHSLMMANMAEIAANAVGANGRLVRVGAYFHDLGKSLSPKYFIENLEAQETSPHDQLPPEVSCDAIFAHVTEGIVSARKAGLHERIVDFMHMHHGNGVLEYFWERCREQGNPHGFTIEDFRYPGHPPQSRETAILAICDAVEAASRTLKKPDAAAIDSLVQRIVYGKLHLGQLDESGLSMSDLRRISDSLRETIRHANHGRIEYPWQKAGQDASASVMSYSSTSPSPRLDSLDHKPSRNPTVPPAVLPPDTNEAALAATADVKNSASDQRVPTNHSAPPSEEPSTAAKIRAGTARNANPSTPPPLAADGSAARTSPTPTRAAPITITGRAPGPLAPTPEPSAGHNKQPPPAASSFDMELPSAVNSFEPPPAADSFDHEPPPAADSFDHEPPPAVDSFENDPNSAVHKNAARLPPAQPHRPPTAPVPLTNRRAASEVARTAGPPPPDDLDNAITNPPPLRRGPSGHPFAPSEPVQLAAALASTVARVTPAPSGTPRPPDNAAPQDTRHADVDSAAANQAAPSSPPRRSASPSSPPRPGTPPASFDSPAPNQTLLGSPAPSPQPPRTTGLADDDRQARPLETLRGHGAAEVPVPGRRGRSASDPPTPRAVAPASDTSPTTLPGISASEARPVASPSTPPLDTSPTTLPGVSASEMRPAAPSSPPLEASPTTLPGVSASEVRPISRLAALLLEDEARVTVARAATKPRGEGEARAAAKRPAPNLDLDAGVTEPSMPILAIGDDVRVDLQVPPAPPETGQVERKAGWASGLAARIDAALDTDEWGTETPIVPPTKAELRALLGQPDPTRPQPVDEIALLQRRAAQLASEHGDAPAGGAEELPREVDAEPSRRGPYPTTEVDPDDIEAAIEIAPPVRRPPNAKAIGVAKPKKSE